MNAQEMLWPFFRMATGGPESCSTRCRNFRTWQGFLVMIWVLRRDLGPRRPQAFLFYRSTRDLCAAARWVCLFFEDPPLLEVIFKKPRRKHTICRAPSFATEGDLQLSPSCNLCLRGTSILVTSTCPLVHVAGMLGFFSSSSSFANSSCCFSFANYWFLFAN